MKKIFPLIFMPLISLFSLSAQITQAEADNIVKERMSDEENYTIYAKENVQTGFEITTTTGEALELDYLCWTYYVNFINETNGKYLIVKESNGNLLEITAKNDEGPTGLEAWRFVISYPMEIPFEEYSLDGTSCEWINLGYNNQIIVINSKEELEQYVGYCNSYPEIDFSNYTLLLASGWVGRAIKEINILFSRNTATKYTLTVEFYLYVAPVLDSWQVSILVPKINTEATVILNRII